MRIQDIWNNEWEDVVINQELPVRPVFKKAIGKIEPQISKFFFSYAICFNLLHLKPSLLPLVLISFFGFVFAR